MRIEAEPFDTSGTSGTTALPVGDAARACVLIRIANFATLRRASGIDQANLLVLEIAERIAALLPDAKVAPIGRDLIELSVTTNDRDALDELVAWLVPAIDTPVQLAGVDHPLQLCAGVALDRSGDDVAQLEAAEAALAEACVARARQEAAVTAETPSDAVLGAELRIAIARHELYLQYQPKLHLRRHEITSIEALIRWRHPQRGLILPNDFIPAAERSGAIRAMTLWTLRQVIADQRVLARHGHALPIFVNIAGVLLSDKAFVATACEMVRDSGAMLGFEITETSVIREPQIAIEHLQRFHDIGVAITIDDYGAGLSSLAYLKQLPARELKIDKLFVTQLASSHRDPLIVRSTIDLAHALEMEVVAEGVETPTSLALLSVMGCDMVQGFLISRPLVLDSLLAYLREESHRALLDQARSPLQRLAAVRARA